MKRVAVIGAGTMGHGLALVHAIGGCQVNLFDINPVVLERAKKLIFTACSTLVNAGVHQQAELDVAQSRIKQTSNIANAVKNAQLVVEAIVEKKDAKRSVFAEIAKFADSNAIIASNTSYLDVFSLLPKELRNKTLIAHWYTPPYIIDLVDIAPGPETDQKYIIKIRDLYKQFGKAPLVFEKLIQGYIANRLQSAMNLECLSMIDKGLASAEDIDYSIRHGLASRLAVLGHMQKMDFTGIEMARNALASRVYIPPKPTGSSITLNRLIEEGRTGVMSGAGHYDYGNIKAEKLLEIRDLKLLELKKAMKDIEGE